MRAAMCKIAKTPEKTGLKLPETGTIKAYGAMAGFAVDWQLSGFHVSWEVAMYSRDIRVENPQEALIVE
ncbi:MAG TPA: hypothetical protein VGI75_05105, partial [Pirellulales bacterium]